jgi:hypothetical protein
MRKSVEELVKGDIILEGRSEIKVNKVVNFACSSRGTHVNGNLCYDRGIRVRTKEGVVPKEETGLEDLEEDYTCPRCGGDHSWCQSVQPGEYGVD